MAGAIQTTLARHHQTESGGRETLPDAATSSSDWDRSRQRYFLPREEP